VIEILATLVDLVLPARCAGCGAAGGHRSLCRECAQALGCAAPQRVRPDPEPPGLPRCVALAAYAGALRGALLGYKERGRFGLAAPLGDRLADVVLAGAGTPAAGLVLVPIPATAAAARSRYGDHMTRLARRAAGRLHHAGYPTTVIRVLRARPRPDSTGLTQTERAQQAVAALTLVPRQLAVLRAATAHGARLVLVDDIITTGSTLAAAAILLGDAGFGVPLAAVLGATQRKAPGTRRGVGPGTVPDLPTGFPKRGDDERVSGG